MIDCFSRKVASVQIWINEEIIQLCIYAFAILNCIKIIQNAYNI